MNKFDKFNEECLYAHNGLRKVHGAKPLIYDKNLARDAERYAHLIAKKKTFHSMEVDREDNVGQSISQSTRQFANYIYSGIGATVGWYAEIRHYDFDLEEQTSKHVMDHFTQILWRQTEKAGFGRSKNPLTNTWYIVGRYFPAGNVRGQYWDNVLPHPEYMRWEDMFVVESYLEELRTWEYSRARRHVLDTYSMTLTVSNKGNEFLIKENFKSPDGEVYHESQIFDRNVTREPRPIFINGFWAIQSELLIQPIRMTEDDVSSDISTTGEPEEMDGFCKGLLARHNMYRKNYGEELLIFDLDLSRYARQWAQVLSNGYFLGFSNYIYRDSEIGENIAMKSEELTETTGKQLVDNWYNENKFYLYDGRHDFIKEYGHFTQIVWRSTRRIGIGISTNASGLHFIVCFYYPPGNVKDQFEQNIPRLIV